MTELIAYLIGILILCFLTFLSYSRGNAVFWMITAGVAMMVGLYSPDGLGGLGDNRYGVGIGILLINYSLLSISLAYANLIRPTQRGKD